MLTQDERRFVADCFRTFKPGIPVNAWGHGPLAECEDAHGYIGPSEVTLETAVRYGDPNVQLAILRDPNDLHPARAMLNIADALGLAPTEYNRLTSEDPQELARMLDEGLPAIESPARACALETLEAMAEQPKEWQFRCPYHEIDVPRILQEASDLGAVVVQVRIPSDRAIFVRKDSAEHDLLARFISCYANQGQFTATKYGIDISGEVVGPEWGHIEAVDVEDALDHLRESRTPVLTEVELLT